MFGYRLFVFAALLSVCHASDARLARVKLVAVDEFGRAAAGCHVHDFVPTRDLIDPKLEILEKDDLSVRFSEDMIATEIPTGVEYEMAVSCGGGQHGAANRVVQRADSFFVIATSQPRGDDYTGTAPRLTVRDSGKLTPPQWVTIVSTISDYRETDELSETSRTAGFFHIRPGTHLLLLVTPNRVVCAIQFVHNDAGASLALDPEKCSLTQLPVN